MKQCSHTEDPRLWLGFVLVWNHCACPPADRFDLLSHTFQTRHAPLFHSPRRRVIFTAQIHVGRPPCPRAASEEAEIKAQSPSVPRRVARRGDTGTQLLVSSRDILRPEQPPESQTLGQAHLKARLSQRISTEAAGPGQHCAVSTNGPVSASSKKRPQARSRRTVQCPPQHLCFEYCSHIVVKPPSVPYDMAKTRRPRAGGGVS
jgi:hypothetical protein